MSKLVFLDDEREPWDPEWMLVKTYDECVQVLSQGNVEHLSLDHDLSNEHYNGDLGDEKTGYHVVLWMAENGIWPTKTLIVHTMNPAGRERMVRTAERFAPEHLEIRVLVPVRGEDGDYLASEKVRNLTKEE